MGVLGANRDVGRIRVRGGGSGGRWISSSGEAKIESTETERPKSRSLMVSEDRVT